MPPQHDQRSRAFIWNSSSKKKKNDYVTFGFPAHPWDLQSATIERRSEKLQKFRLFSI